MLEEAKVLGSNEEEKTSEREYTTHLGSTAENMRPDRAGFELTFDSKTGDPIGKIIPRQDGTIDAADLEYFQTLQKLVPRMTQLVAKMKRQSEE